MNKAIIALTCCFSCSELGQVSGWFIAHFTRYLRVCCDDFWRCWGRAIQRESVYTVFESAVNTFFDLVRMENCEGTSLARDAENLRVDVFRVWFG